MKKADVVTELDSLLTALRKTSEDFVQTKMWATSLVF